MEIIRILLKWDSIIYHLINKSFYNPKAFFFFQLLTNLIDLIILVLALYWLFTWFFNKQRLKSNKIGFILIPVFIAAIINIILKIFIRRGAPIPLVMPWLEISLPILPLMYAFPSGHACRAFALASMVSIQTPQKRILFYFIAALIGFSRIYIGAHYPSDVIAGAALGIFVSWIFKRFVPEFEKE